MKTKLTIFLLGLVCCYNVSAQTFNKVFKGAWNNYLWRFEFKIDSSFTLTRITQKADSTQYGKYYISLDTLHILGETKDKFGALNPTYFIEADTLIIDLQNLFDYTSSTKIDTFESRRRYDILHLEVTIDELVKKTEESIQVLKTKPMKEITDKEHIQILRIYNTLLSRNPIFEKEVFKEYEKGILKRYYFRKIIELYPWRLNRGRGFYFPDLKVEMGGSPHYWSSYHVIIKKTN